MNPREDNRIQHKVFEAIVKEDGTLTVKVPQSLSGKKVKVTIEEDREKESLSAWNELSGVLKKADALDIPRRDSKDIIDDLRTFRESK
ncbi:MAG: hypothetical protein AB1611_15850 [bacterium]